MFPIDSLDGPASILAKDHLETLAGHGVSHRHRLADEQILELRIIKRGSAVLLQFRNRGALCRS